MKFKDENLSGSFEVIFPKIKKKTLLKEKVSGYLDMISGNKKHIRIIRF